MYREAGRRYIKALAAEFHDYPAIIGWQLERTCGLPEPIIFLLDSDGRTN
jgi:hypothetical protein